MTSDRSAKVKATLAKTRERRATQSCMVVVCKIDASRLSDTQKHDLNRLFMEAKWLVNDIIASPDVFAYQQSDHARVRCKDGNGGWSYEDRRFLNLSAQERQALHTEVKDSIRAMAAKKRKALAAGRKPPKQGRLKYRKTVDEIPLKQYGATYRFKGRSLVHVQGVTGNLRIEGSGRLDPRNGNPGSRLMEHVNRFFATEPSCAYEYANAKLLHRESGYYIAFTLFEDTIGHQARTYAHEAIIHHVPASDSELGLDAGQTHEITESDGTTMDNRFTETTRLKNAQRRMSRTGKEHRGWWHARHEYRLEHERLRLRREHAAKQTFHLLHAKARTIYAQDENIKEWARRDCLARGSRKIHHGILGRLYAMLRHDPDTIMAGRWQPTTAWCRNCGRRTKHPPGKETYHCPYCGLTEPRDQHAAANMKPLALHPIESKLLHQPRTNPIGPYQTPTPSN